LGVTGHADDKYKTEGAAVGMDDVLAKPVYYDILLDWLTRLELI